MSNESLVKLFGIVRPEGIAWEMRDGTRVIGSGSCGTVADLRGVEVRAGVGETHLRGSLSDADRALAQQYGWKIEYPEAAS